MNTNLVFVCIPTRDLWKAEFGISLAQMVGRCFVDHGSPTHGFKVFAYPITESGSGIAENRNKLVRRALANKDTSHVLFVDDDQMFPADAIHRLMAHDLDIVGANIVRKEANPRTNSRKLNSTECAWTLPDSTGIEEVDYNGTGLMLVKREVFEKMGDDKWFFYDIDKKIGEDVYFCWKAKELGYKVYIDHDLSKSVKHVGHFYWGHEHTNEWINHDK